MKTTYDATADALYITFKRNKVSGTLKLADRLVVDLDKDGNTVGIEILDAKKQLSIKDFSNLSSIPLETLSQA